MYLIFDSFNNRVISKHRTIKGAGKKGAKFLKDFKKNNSANSYARIILMKRDRTRLTDYEYDECVRYISFRF